jgi:homoserine dehydrogenase
MATAVSVVADVLDVARAQLNGAAGLATRGIQLESRPLRSPADVESRHYLRFQVFDRPGVLASIAGSLGEARVSIEQMVQEGGGDSSGSPVQVVMLTHASTWRDLERALERIAAADFVAKPTRVLRVVDAA